MRRIEVKKLSLFLQILLFKSYDIHVDQRQGGGEGRKEEREREREKKTDREGGRVAETDRLRN